MSPAVASAPDHTEKGSGSDHTILPVPASQAMKLPRWLSPAGGNMLSDGALHAVMDERFALLRRLEADGGGDAGRCFGGVAVAPRAVIADGAALGARLLAHRRELFGGAVAVI